MLLQETENLQEKLATSQNIFEKEVTSDGGDMEESIPLTQMKLYYCDNMSDMLL